MNVTETVTVTNLDKFLSKNQNTHFVSKKLFFSSAFLMKFLDTVRAICADSFITSPR